MTNLNQGIAKFSRKINDLKALTASLEKSNLDDIDEAMREEYRNTLLDHLQALVNLKEENEKGIDAISDMDQAEEATNKLDKVLDSYYEVKIAADKLTMTLMLNSNPHQPSVFVSRPEVGIGRISSPLRPQQKHPDLAQVQQSDGVYSMKNLIAIASWLFITVLLCAFIVVVIFIITATGEEVIDYGN